MTGSSSFNHENSFLLFLLILCYSCESSPAEGGTVSLETFLDSRFRGCALERYGAQAGE